MAIKPPTPESIKEAVALLQRGEVVAFPTETVYGLGADATSDSAVKKIYKVKGRPSNNPLIIHTYSKEAAAIFADLSNPITKSRFDKLSSLWPGPLSLIVPASPKICKTATAGHSTVALRVPNHSVALALLKEANLPIAAPSANQSFYVSPTTASHVESSIGAQTPLIIDGGKCQIGLESTVIDLTSEYPTILRPGSITTELLEKTLGEKVEYKKISAHELEQGIISPGMLAKHYSPRTPLEPLNTIAIPTHTENYGVIRFSPDTQLNTLKPKIVVTISQKGHLNEVASNLYDAIRELDDLNLDLILIDSCSQDGIGRAIMDRIERALHK